MKDKIEALNEKMGLEDYVDESTEDQEEPMTIDRKIHMLGKIFPFSIGDHVRNSLDEEGIIDLVGLDERGVIYLVKYKRAVITWETNLTKIPKYTTSKENPTLRPEIKTDVEE